jgi:Tetratricopeptide repeat
MKTTCKHHPTEPAHWHCLTCDTYFCPSCVLKREKSISGVSVSSKQYLHLCPSCMQEAKWVAATTALEPFWTRLHKIFLYPFSLHSIILIVGLAILNMFFSGLTLFSKLMQLVLWGLLYKYAFAVLKSTAKGNLVPPALSKEVLTDDFGEAFKQIGIFIAIFFFFFLIVQFTSPVFGYIYLFPAILAIPVMIIVYVATGSVLHALNPVTTVKIITRIGWPYLLMYGFILILGGAPNVIVKMLLDFIPLKATQFIFFLANAFYCIVTYHLMGYVLLQYHQEVGYKIDFEDFCLNDTGQDTSEPDQQNEFTSLLEPMLKDGKYDEAIRLIEEYPEERIAEDAVLSNYYFSLLKLTKRQEKMLQHGESHLALLVKENEKQKALKVYSDCVSASNDFLPVPLTLLKIGGWFNEAGDSKNAIKAYNRIIKSYPDDNLSPKAYFRAAQIFSDRLMNVEKAKKIFTVIIKKFPESDEASLARNYVKQMPT